MIVLRPAAGPAIGAGHAMRCLAVAEALLALGVEIAFAVDEVARATVPRLQASGVRLIGPEPVPCALALLDGYGFSAEDERGWGAAGAKVAAFEDVPGRPHACDLLIDPAPGRRSAAYADTAPGARTLLGAAYAPLSPRFAAARDAALARRAQGGPIRRVLVSTGLTDAGAIASKALAALHCFPSVEVIDVAVGAAAPSLPALRAVAAADPRVRLHVDAEDMAELIAAADLGVGAAGTSSWERCALGLPSVVVVAAANQADNAAALIRSGAALVAGEATDMRAETLAGSIGALEPAGVRWAMSQAAADLVDAHGAERIARALLELGGDPGEPAP